MTWAESSMGQSKPWMLGKFESNRNSVGQCLLPSVQGRAMKWSGRKWHCPQQLSPTASKVLSSGLFASMTPLADSSMRRPFALR